MLRSHFISELKPGMSGEVRVAGWIDRIKDVGRFRFIWIRDRSGIGQVTVSKEQGELYDAAMRLGLHDFIAVRGVILEKPVAKVGVEVKPISIEVLSRAESPLPLEVGGFVKSGLSTRLDWRPIDLRNPRNLAILRIQAALVKGMQSYLDSNGFIQVFTPCLIGAGSEGGAELFEVDYFGRKAYLRQDPQLHRQLLMVAGLDRIYDLGPSWRAEPSHTPRHLCEYRSCAVELSFIEDERDVMKIEEELVVAGVKEVAEECEKELKLLGIELEVPEKPFPVLEFPKIYEILEDMGKRIPYGEDLDREAEKLLASYVKENFDHDFFFINRFPYRVKPFYVMKIDGTDWARSTDLIGGGLELSSGGQREHRYERIVKQIREKGLSLKDFEWFVEHFKYGAPPHGGFAIGIERLTMILLNLENIREATPFPRAPERLLP
ncbi:MAG: aspartate--tRNA(Asn) ligase [Thaumarchaeota archaeon]|nr:aspartate--tRNA(Asn) ligase [Nitrososphaerota archaeon]